MRFKHILVNHAYEAEDILRLLNDGKDFSELATKFSKCSSATQGGDLGAVSLNRLDPDFVEAAEILKVATYTTKPVRTRFGYHLILRYS